VKISDLKIKTTNQFNRRLLRMTILTLERKRDGKNKLKVDANSLLARKTKTMKKLLRKLKRKRKLKFNKLTNPLTTASIPSIDSINLTFFLP